MSCYSNEMKNMCQKVVAGISVLLGIAGIATAALGASAGGQMPEEVMEFIKQSGQKVPDIKGMATPVMALGVLLILVSLLGCATAKMKTPCFAIPFGLTTCLFGLILLIIAFVSLAMGTVLDQFTKAMCPEEGRSKLALTDADYNKFIDKQMCTDLCPCQEGDEKRWPSTMSDVEARKYGRTFTPTTAEQMGYSTNGYNAAIVPFLFQKDAAGTFKSFAECYNDKLNKAANKDKSKNGKFKKWANDGGFKTIAALEKNLKCQGLCVTPMFYVSLDYWNEPATTCLPKIVEVLSGPMKTAGYVALVTALIAFVAFCGSFPLCSGYNKDEDEK